MSMLKFSVVHAPLNGEPGLEPDYMDPFDVDNAMYQGKTETSYGDAGVSELPKTSKPEKKKKKKKLVAGIDFDGTVTLEPRAFKSIIDRIIAEGGECHLITGRPDAESKEVKAYCDMYGLRFTSMKFYPVHYKFSVIDYDPAIDVKIAKWKAETLNKISADVMVDDSYIYAMAMVKHAPNVLILKPMLGGL